MEKIVSYDTKSMNPTKKAYEDLNASYDFFNARLFGNRLPRCLITMQRKSHAYGYFAGDRFGTRDGQQVTDEIALNPRHFQERSTEESLSTLVHEMVHLRQHHFGTPSRAGYHNREWAGMMKELGLYPSDTGAPGGKETGPRVSHYIVAGGAFERVCAEVIRSGCEIAYVEVWSDENGKAKAASKTKYACPSCGLNAWAKPEVLIMCAECRETMEAEQ